MQPKEFFESEGLSRIGDLVELLRTYSRSKYKNKTEGSIRSFLSQTMNGERKLSKDLEQSIIACFKHWNKNLSVEIFEKQLINSFNEAFLLRRKQKGHTTKELDVRVAKDDYELLLERTKVALRVTIVSAEPAEIKNNSRADKLKMELLRKVGIIKSVQPKVPYEFYLAKGGDSYNIPKKFWEGLYRYAKSIDSRRLNDRIKKSNEGKNPLLKVLVVPDPEIDITYGILNEGNPAAIGFITIYNPSLILDEDIEDISVSRMQGETLNRVLKKIDRLRNHPEVKEFTFADFLKTLA